MNVEIIDKYNKISTPDELLVFMSKYINYGYLGKNKKIYHFDDVDFDNDWYLEYILETKDDILSTLFGNCFDQTELERDWFFSHGYCYKTIYIMADLVDSSDCPCHSFLVYKNNNDNGWNWFENSDFNNRGIHKFDNLDDLLSYQKDNYINFLKTLDICESKIKNIIRKEFSKPKDNISACEYLEWVVEKGIDI